MSCGHRLPLACSRPGVQVIYHTTFTPPTPNGAGAWLARNFRVFVTEVGKISWKARHTRSLVITKRKLGLLRYSEVEVRNRVRFDYILENRFGMFDSRQANLQLLSSLAFLLLFSQADGTAPGLEGLYESVNARKALFKVENRRRAPLQPLTANLFTPRESGILHCWKRSHWPTNFGGKSLLCVPLQGL